MLARTESEVMQAAADLKAEGYDVEGFVCDVSSYDACAKAVAAVIERFGKIDCLYNNAGILGDRLGILEFDPEGFKQAYNVNVFGTMYMIQLVSRTMVERKIEGSIINTSSLNGETITWDPVGYITSKWAINGITRTCAFQLAGYKIRVNAVAPGATVTPMAHASWEDENVRKVVASMHLRNMWIQPEMVADAAFFLASDASYGVNGQILHVDDGYCVGKSADFTSIGAQH
jgi:NAD(P)-dependent dehydrogenase (short-subunit alcohol dehydrogenase family)